jgi:Tfp pilus assembly protein PilN
MNQQINLYQPIFRKQKEFLSAIAMAQLSVVALLFFAGLYGYSLHQMQQMQSQLATVKNNVTKMKVSVAEFQSRQVLIVPSKLLQAEINRASDELAQRKRIVNVLSKGSFANTTGFSGHFEALARQHLNGSWLTGISIETGGESISLKGITYAPELVPRYLQRLLEEAVFAEASFSLMELNRSAENTEEILFTVGTDIGEG